ncbi:putative beta-glucosidase H [Aspergillus heterothallicus]
MMAFDPDEVLRKLSADQKVALLTGSDFWHTQMIPELNVPSIRLSDGSSGIRGTRWFEGVPTAALPCGTALASTWDKALLRQAGELLGKECIAKGVHCWLGPTVNIQRSPLGGRGAESFAEDPYLTGIIAREMIIGCESTGVISTVKHLVCNDQEESKRGLDVRVTDRALREIYLRPFQIVARDAKPGALMTAYNRVNGVHASEHAEIMEMIVRQEWGWNPLIMSDWYGLYSCERALNAGLDLEMPGKTEIRGSLVSMALSTNSIKPSVVDSRVSNILRFAKRASQALVSPVEGQRDYPEDRELNRQLCNSSIVLLKNEEALLPLPKNLKKLALIGSHVRDLSVLGLGSTAVEAYYTTDPLDSIRGKLGLGTEVSFEVGAYAHKMLPILSERLMKNAVLRFFSEPASGPNRTAIDQTPLKRSYFHLIDYVNEKINPDLFFASFEADFIPDYSGVWELGLTVHGTGTLFLDDEMIVDNCTTQRQGTSFFGSGTVEEKGTKKLEAGRTYKVRIEFGCAATTKLDLSSSVNFPGGGGRLGACPLRDETEMIERAARVASEADYAIICVGLSGEWEGEGNDRTNMKLPPNVDKMIQKVLERAPNTVVVNISGMPVEMPWHNSAKSIIQASYGGSEAGNSIADTLFGDFNPSGKLPLSWPYKLEDNPTFLNWGSSKGRVLYGEDVFVGYRFYEKLARQPLWSFGHGLSYTSFELFSLELKRAEDKMYASVDIRNTGALPGAEVVQLYISAIQSSVPRPRKELAGFEKVFLAPGQSERVNIEIEAYTLSFWDESENKWCLEEGQYQVAVGTSSAVCGGHGLECSLRVDETRWWLGLEAPFAA